MHPDKKTYNDGVYNISNEEYHAANGISRSQLMLFDKSPYHFWYECISGLKEKEKPTESMIIGNAFHTLLLEPHTYSNYFCMKPEIEKLPELERLKDVGREEYDRQKEQRTLQSEINKALLATFEIESTNKTVITKKQYDKALKMAELVRNHEIVDTLLNESVFEQSIFWTDKETGIQFKVRPDIWSQKMVVDVKTSQDAGDYAFTRSALKYGYYLQAGMIYEACQSIGKKFDMFVHLVVEKEEPHVPSVFVMHEESLQFGIDQFQLYKQKLKACCDSNKWPGYPVKELTVPKYALVNDEE